MDEDFYINLLYKKLDQRIGPEDDLLLQNWLKASDDHRLIADSIEKVWEAGGRYKKSIEVNLDAEFEQLTTRIEADETKIERITTPKAVKKENPVVKLQVLWRAAAVIALLVVFALVIRNYLSPQTAPWQAVATTDTQEILDLADGSKVWINKQSKLEYPEAYAGNERRVKLQGEAFFDVAKDANRPFIIETSKGRVQVLGTSFNVRSLAEEQQLAVEVHTGLVRIQSVDEQQSIEVAAGETAILDVQTGQFQKTKDLSPNAAAWHNKRLVFIDAPLKTVLEDLEQYYGINLKLDNSQLGECPFTSTFNDAKVDDILQLIKGVFQLEYSKKDKLIELKGGNCQ
ncbi:MAG: FecR domain-containing protein [Bacteroidota bacterium]